MLSRFSECSVVLVATILMSLLFSVTLNSAFAASYDCRKAKLAAETAICRDDKLSRLDEKMALQYSKLRAFLSRGRELARRQRAFISARNMCDGDATCLTNVYQIRINELCKLGQINGHPCDVLFTNITSKENPQLNYCHMDECGWFVIRQMKQIAKNKEGELIEVTVTSGTSNHYPTDSDAGEYPSKFEESIPIEWANEPSTWHVFCSKVLPAVLYKEESGVEVSPLDFGGQGIFGYNSSDAGFYVYSCEHLAPSSYDADGFAAKYGFRPLPEGLSIEIGNVGEILDVAKKVSEGTYSEPGKTFHK